MKKCKSILLLLLCAVLLLSGCSVDGAGKEKTLSCQGLTMTIPSHYRDLMEQGYYSDYTFVYSYGEVTLFADKVPLDTLEGWEPTLTEFARNFTYANGINALVKEEYGLLTVYYETQGDMTWGCLAAFYSYDGGFWVLQYSCPAETYSELKQEFLQSLATVELE